MPDEYEYYVPARDLANTDKSCWGYLPRTRLALILILMVAVPFLIVLVIVYILCFVSYSEGEECEKLCDAMREQYAITETPRVPYNIPDWGEPDKAHRYHVPGVKDQSEDKSVRKREHHQIFPIGALLEDLYMDEDKEQIFKCSVALISEKFVLTTRDCIGDDEIKTEHLLVRINSNFWSKGGNLRRVKNILNFEKLAAIEIMEDDPKVEEFVTLSKFFPEAAPVLGFVWNKKLRFHPLIPLQVNLNQSLEHCLDEGSPLLDQSRDLIGFATSVDCSKNTFSFIGLNECRDWLNKLLN